MSRLDAGESEALSLALELHADAVLMDEAGWKVLRVWECDLAKMANWPRVARRISRRIAKPEFAAR